MMILKTIIVGLTLFAQQACSSAVPQRWEHGWQTKHVRATRYTNPDFYYNIGFTFPLNPNDCDRIEIFDFIKAHKGAVFQAGGYPGAEVFALFEGVTDRASADQKLQAILPAFERVVAAF